MSAQPQKETVNAFERSIGDIIADLSKEIPPRLLSHKKMGGKDITYISWHVAIKFLDLYAPGWSYEIRQVVGIGGDVIVAARITVPCVEGFVFREATGNADEESDSFGSPSDKAESKALRRAAAKFGLGLYLYDKH